MKISDELLYECAGEAAKVWLDTIPEDDFHPSFRFRMKMKILLRKMSQSIQTIPSFQHPLHLRRMMLVSILLIVCMIMGMLSLGAFSERYIRLITNEKSDHTEFLYTSSGGEEDLFVPLVPKYLPAGMEEVERDGNSSNLYVRYKNTDGNYIGIDQTFFSQKTASTLILDTEDAYTETYMLDEYEVFYVEKEDRRTLLYMDGNIRVLVKGNVSKEELEKVTLSLE